MSKLDEEDKHFAGYDSVLTGNRWVLINPLSDLLPDVFCLMVRIFRLMLFLLYIYIYICIYIYI